MKRYLAEFLGSLFLVLTVGLSLSADIGVMAPLVMGCMLVGLTYLTGHLSGAHLNPAISVAVLIRGRMNWKEAGWYVLAQLLGGFAAAGLALILVQDDAFRFAEVVSPPSNATYFQVMLVECLFSFLLVLVHLRVIPNGHQPANAYFGLALGMTFLASMYAARDISVGIFNPATAVGPNIVGAEFHDFWLYLVGPLLGAVLAAFTANFLEKK
ncbi:MAG: aquaporin [Bacteroidota bacterium]